MSKKILLKYKLYFMGIFFILLNLSPINASANNDKIQKIPLVLISPKAGDTWLASPSHKIVWKGGGKKVKVSIVNVNYLSMENPLSASLYSAELLNRGFLDVTFLPSERPIYKKFDLADKLNPDLVGDYKINVQSLDENNPGSLWSEVFRISMSKNPSPKMWDKTYAPKFEDFSVSEVYSGQNAKVKLFGNSDAEYFRTNLNNGSKEKTNFAGHYNIVDWGCGTECVNGMMIDNLTGNVFAPAQFFASRDEEYKANSGLFILNPANEADREVYKYDQVSFLPVKYYLWDKNKLNLIYWQRCNIVDDKQICEQ